MALAVGSMTANIELSAETESPEEKKAIELLKRTGAFLSGKFTLANGTESDYYFDSKELTLHPDGAEFVAFQLLRKLEEKGIVVVGGTAYGAIPIVSHLCLYSKIKGKNSVSAFYHRKESKEHGRFRVVDGKVPAKGSTVAIVEDVVTTGKSLLNAIALAEEIGCEVTDALVLVDRDEGGREAVEEKGYMFWSLFTVCRTANGKVRFRFNGV